MPPPGGQAKSDLKVTVVNKVVRITDFNFNFNIKVSDSECKNDPENCFGTVDDIEENTAKGLKCDAFVQKSDFTCYYENTGTHVPCLKWDNFLDKTKYGGKKFFFSSADAKGVKLKGIYHIRTNC